MSEIETSGARSDRRSGQFSDYSELGRLGGWDLDFRQLDPGAHPISASIVSSDRLLIMRMQFGCGFHQLGCSPPGMLTVGLPMIGMNDWFGRPYQSGSILPFNHASGVDGVSHPGFEAFTISIAEDFLRDCSAAHRLPWPDHLSAPKSGTWIPNSRFARMVRRAMWMLTNDAPARMEADWESELAVNVLMAAHVDSRVDESPAPAVRARAVSAALEFIAANQHQATTVGEICSQTGVSWRTLDRAFVERFGIGPKAYLQRLRLAGVRKDLLTSSRRMVIADVANHWGFWHLGQFARDYRGLFDELPSATQSRSGS